MCIIAGEVRRVAGTKLFVMPSTDRRRQITVYSNKVDTPGSNVMCLPVPNPSTVSFETVYKGLFDDCTRSFSYHAYRSLYAGLSAESPSAYLPIQSHGSYEVVLAPTLDDLDRVPPGFLTLSDDVKRYLRANYSGREAPFGALLCKLRAGAIDYEPFAYSYAMLLSGELFVPTRHYHVEGGHSHDLVSDSDADDWDHEVYTILTPTEIAHTKSGCIPMATNRVDWSKMPVAYRHGGRFPMCLFERIGRGPNEDLMFPLAAPTVGIPRAVA